MVGSPLGALQPPNADVVAVTAVANSADDNPEAEVPSGDSVAIHGEYRVEPCARRRRRWIFHTDFVNN